MSAPGEHSEGEAIARLSVELVAVLLVVLVGCGGSPAASQLPTESSVTPIVTTAPIPDSTAAATVRVAPSAWPSPVPVEPTGDLLFFRGSRVEGGLNGSAWLASVAGGQRLQLGPAIEASWAENGQSIQIVSQDDTCVPNLTTVSLDGSSVSGVVRKGLRSEDGAFAWSPDGRQVVFSRYHNGPPAGMCGSQGGAYVSEEVVQDIMLMNADGTSQRVLVPLVWPQRPITWSPDGTRIAFANAVGDLGENQLDLVAVRVSDGVETKLTAAPLEGMTSPRWSPDGTRLAFKFSIEGVTHMGVMRVDGARLLDLGTGDDYAQPPPVWSPDGETIATAFEIASDGTLNPGGIVIHRADGTGRRELSLTDINVYSPLTWSPDGAWLAYNMAAGRDGGWGGIALVSTDGSSRRELPETSGAQWVAWQPAP
jgi:Tol biopolymer transport system component